MSLTVKIVDNETGRVVLNENNADVLMGVVGRGGDIHSITHIKCKGIELAHAAMFLQKILEGMCTKHPEINPIIRMLSYFDELEGLTDTNK